MFRPASGICLSLLVLTVVRPASADTRGDLARARAAYNDGRYAAAIAAGSAIPATAQETDAARLVIGRAHLEQFRHTQDPGDLAAARDAFQALHPANLSAHDRLQLLVGLGESLYLDGLFGPAGDLFGAALLDPGPFGPGEHDRLLDWWATAIDREAQQQAADRRAPLYRRMAAQMREVRRQDPASGVAAYWVVEADRGAGDLDAAWNAAIAYWVRAPLMGSRAATLRPDLDRLTIDAIIPERARQLAPAPNDVADVAADLRAEWEVVKKQWGGP
ncbi:MAG TPA: hypothetical protein VND92_05935 [Vicinamibacterales bacterium]|nr:hypothetical protein [Vicinamibacterales bacterium]